MNCGGNIFEVEVFYSNVLLPFLTRVTLIFSLGALNQSDRKLEAT